MRALPMHQVKITELRSHLPDYLEQVHKGKEIWITCRGKVIARLLPPIDSRKAARDKLKELRQHAYVGDVISPIDEEWDVDK
ncbi:MAG: type II toxin-antitoxin system prevent-host-death family antitoxin [Gammaproteobacteria bacterium]|nr:MAG: type II toxin-antitoxin system prevent-host-death family antitoxin [Gammaproteobacteria bacterium]